MIFVTVGTHEQPMNRLVKYIDELKAKELDEEVIIQTGFSTYEPKNCKWQKLFPFQEMDELVAKARIVITHGGPSSFIAPLQKGKIPIVVPRKKEFDEHVNDHQLEFCRAVKERQGNIILVEDVEKLGGILNDYNEIIKKMPSELKSNNERFCSEFEKITDALFEK
ncbi:MAG: multidrug MFS transporter [Ruminococcus sp.]|nr:multidrug MFS transporter [Ruminococcus sp.]